jgi:hypothetical protein
LPLVFFLSVAADGDQVRLGGLRRLAQGAGEGVAIHPSGEADVAERHLGTEPAGDLQALLAPREIS